MATIGTLAINIIARTTGLTTGVGRARRQMLSFNKAILTTRNLFAGLFVGTGIIRGFKSLLAVASEMEETMAKFNVVFGENATIMEAWSLQFSKSFGRARKDVASWSAELQDIFVPLGFSRDQAMMFSKSLVQLGVDVASFNEKADRDVMRNFTSAIVGSHRAVRQYGIAISETRIKQQAWVEGIQKSFSELTDLEKVFLRYRIILNDTRDAQGDAIRTQDSYANQLKRTKALITDLKQEIGEKLLPTMVGLLKATRNLITAFANMPKETIKNVITIGKFVLNLGLFLAIVPKVVGGIIKIVKGLQALAAGQAIVLGLTPGAGWVALAAGVAIAAAAVVSINLAFDDAIRNTEKLSKEMGGFTDSAGLAVVGIDNIRSALDRAVRPGDGLVGVFTRIRKEIEKLTFSEKQLLEFDLQRELGGKGRLTPGFAPHFAEFDKLFSKLEMLRAAKEALEAGNAATAPRFQSAGRFDVFRSDLVSVAGLDSGLGVDNQILSENRKQTQLLGRIANQEILN